MVITGSNQKINKRKAVIREAVQFRFIIEAKSKHLHRQIQQSRLSLGL
jgi:hypothetical protein